MYFFTKFLHLFFRQFLILKIKNAFVEEQINFFRNFYIHPALKYCRATRFNTDIVKLYTYEKKNIYSDKWGIVV